MLRLFSVLIWTVVYFYAASVKIHSTWRMSIFKIRDWSRLINDWRSGKWIVDTTNEYIFCSVLGALIPLWLIGILIIWRLLRPKIPTAHVIQKATASHPFIPTYTPASMPSQGKSAVLETPPPSTNNEASDDTEQEETQTDWVPKDAGEAHALEVITQIAEENGLTPFPHVLLENELIPITISSDVDALLIKVLAEQGTWQVSMTEPLEQSNWLCNGQAKNVLKEIILGKGVLSKMEPESKVIPVVVLAQGGLENQDVVLSWLSQRGVEVVSLPENPQQGISQLSDILVKYFGSLEEEEEENDAEQSAVAQETPV